MLLKCCNTEPVLNQVLILEPTIDHQTGVVLLESSWFQKISCLRGKLQMHQALHKSEFGVLRLSPLNGLRPWWHSELYTSYRAVRISEQMQQQLQSEYRIFARYSAPLPLWGANPLYWGALDLVEHLCQLKESAALLFPAMQASLEPRSGSGNELCGLISVMPTIHALCRHVS